MSFSSHVQLNLKLNPQREIPYLLVPNCIPYNYNYVNGKNDSNIDQIISCLLKPTLMAIILSKFVNYTTQEKLLIWSETSWQG